MPHASPEKPPCTFPGNGSCHAVLHDLQDPDLACAFSLMAEGEKSIREDANGTFSVRTVRLQKKGISPFGSPERG